MASAQHYKIGFKGQFRKTSKTFIFDEYELSFVGGQTYLRVAVSDQSQLLGILREIRDRGLTLYSLHLLE